MQTESKKMISASRHRNLARVAERMAIVSLAASLAACGGGGGDSGTPTPPPPPPAPAPAPASAGDLSTTVHATTYAAGSRQALAYAVLNTVRLTGGYGTLAQSADLDAETQNQADYVSADDIVINTVLGGPMYVDLTVLREPGDLELAHAQLPGTPGFIAYTPAARATHFGYTSANLAEVSAAYTTLPAPTTDSTECLARLLASPGHRQGLLDPRFRDVGIGFDTLAPAATDGSLFAMGTCYLTTGAATGAATAPAGWAGIYPPDGSTVSALDDGHGHGYAPSVVVDSSLTLTVNSFVVTDANGTLVPVTLGLDADTSLTNWAFATPNAALAPNTEYTVTFNGSAGGRAINKTWRFTTPAS